MSKPLIVVNNQNTPIAQKEDEAKRSRLGRFKYFFKKHLPKKKKVKGSGRLMGTAGWTEEDIQKIVHEIGKRCPGVTGINIYKHELNFNFECAPEEFLGKSKVKKELPNPSKRKDKNTLDENKKCTP